MGNSVFKSKNKELSWPLDETRNAFRKSVFNNIPNEIVLHIFRHLSVRDLCNVSLVCRSFKMITDDDELWKSKCNTSKKLSSKSYKEIYQEWMQGKSLRNQRLQQSFYKFHSYSIPCVAMGPPTSLCRSSGIHNFKSIGGFKQHPNSIQKMTIDFTVDLDETVYELLIMLEKASQFQEQWQQSSTLKQMIRRYYRFMQLKASHPPNTLLIPTLDIEIVWQTHLLRPEMYRNDCLRLFRRIIDHSLILNDMERFFKEQAFLDTCQLYEQKFGEKYCSLIPTEEKENISSYCFYFYLEERNFKTTYAYWDKTYFEFSSNPPNDYENPFSFTEGDVILDGKWLELCKRFMYNPKKQDYHNRVYRYLQDGIIDLGPGDMKRLKKSYERFLYMAAKYPLNAGNGFIPPTYAIDIIWHSHMQEPLNYEADCLRLVGYLIYHDPWPIIEDEKMKKSCNKVDKIWKDEFQCDIGNDHLYNTSDNKNKWSD